MNEKWIGKEVEGMGRDLMLGNVMVFEKCN